MTKRVAEPSTWASIAAMAQMFAAFLPPDKQWIAHAATGVAASLGIGLQEKGQAAPTPPVDQPDTPAPTVKP